MMIRAVIAILSIVLLLSIFWIISIFCDKKENWDIHKEACKENQYWDGDRVKSMTNDMVKLTADQFIKFHITDPSKYDFSYFMTPGFDWGVLRKGIIIYNPSYDKYYHIVFNYNDYNKVKQYHEDSKKQKQKERLLKTKASFIQDMQKDLHDFEEYTQQEQENIKQECDRIYSRLKEEDANAENLM